MSRDTKQGRKAGRKERHQASQRALKERKKLRRERAKVHVAMTESARLVRSKKKGTRDFEENMRKLGYEPREKTGRYLRVGREVPGDVLDKYEVIS